MHRLNFWGDWWHSGGLAGIIWLNHFVHLVALCLFCGGCSLAYFDIWQKALLILCPFSYLYPVLLASLFFHYSSFDPPDKLARPLATTCECTDILTLGHFSPYKVNGHLKLCPLGGFFFATVLVLREAYPETKLVCRLSTKECVGKDCGKKKKEARLGRGEIQLGIGLMATLVDLIGSAGTKMIFQTCPSMAGSYISTSVGHWV